MPSTGEILFNKFEILKWLKKDEFAAVYRANHIYLGKPIVLKVLDTHALPDEATVQRFKREAKILARLDHPNIIRVLDFGLHEQFFYISFEYFESQSLRSLLKHRSLSPVEKKHILVQILQGLQYAHANEVIHRDIKCENILVDDELCVKIADFGLALTSAESRVTHPEVLVGTPSYMSPEQILGQPVTPQSDLFSLGIVAYEMYIGTHPFIGKDINQSLNNIVSFDEDELFKSLSESPEEIQPIITNLLRKNPRDRFQTAEEVLAALHVPPGSAQSLRRPKKKSYVYITAAFVAVFSLIATLFIVNNVADKMDISVHHLPVEQEISQRTSPDSTVRESLSAENAEISTKKTASSAQLLETKPGQRSFSREPSDKSQPASMVPEEEPMGELYIECLPWAYVVLDSARIDTTPLRHTIHVAAGVHDLQLVHPSYPMYHERIHVSPSQVTTVKVNLDTLFGFLQVDAFPWGEVLVNGISYGITPLQSPIKLTPGEYTVTIKNEQFGSVERIAIVSRRDTAQVRHRFERL